MKPLIVMGMGRSGTRYFADIISSNNEIVLHGEIPHSAMSRFIKLLDILDDEHGRDEVRLRKWHEKKLKFMLGAFGSMSMGGEVSIKGCKYVGHKTPRSEKFFDAYESHFKSAGERPVYFYCIRNPFDVWASFKNMPWNVFDSVEKFSEDYVNSYNRYKRASKRAKGRVNLLNLDSYKRSSSPSFFLRSQIFEKLDLELDDGFVGSLLAKENTNSSKSFVGRVPDEISSKDYQYIINDKDMRIVLGENFPWIL